MVIKQLLGGEVEVRIRKGVSEPPTYFDEYADLSKRENDNAKEWTRYIIPEETTYAFDVKIGRNSFFGDYTSVRVILRDLASGDKLFSKLWADVCYDTLRKDMTFKVEKTNVPLVVDGVQKENLDLSFKALAIDEDHSDDITKGTDDFSSLSGLVLSIRICDGGEKIYYSNEKIADDIAKYNTDRKTYTAQKTEDSLESMSIISQKTFNKGGISHQTSLSGGNPIPLGPPKKYHTQRRWKEIASFKYMCRTENFISINDLRTIPAKLELYPWSALDHDERRNSFKKLQEHDRLQIIALQREELRSNPSLELEKKLVRGSEGLVYIQRQWGMCYDSERQDIFARLQARRKYIDNGEIPPEEILAGEKNEEGDEKSKVSSGTAVEMMAETAVKIKNEPTEAPNTPRVVSAESDIIILDDTPPGTPARSKSPVPHIKSEITGRDITQPRQLKRQNESTSDMASHKKVKSEPEERGAEEEKRMELKRLEKEAEEDEEELRQAQRIAEMLRKRRERNERMQAMRGSSY